MVVAVKEAGLILLQTIPEHININQLRSDFQQAFPDITDIHDLHVWRLNQSKVFCTAHVRFRDARDYLRVNQDVTRFFLEYGVTQVTVQPEFSSDGPAAAGPASACLMRCPGESCLRAHCCAPAAPDAQHYVRVASDLSLPEAPASTTARARPAAAAAAAASKRPEPAAAATPAPVRVPSPPAPSRAQVDVVVELNAVAPVDALPARPGSTTAVTATLPDRPTATPPSTAEEALSPEDASDETLSDDKTKQD